MKASARFRMAMELLIELAAMAVLARVLVPAVGALASSLLTMFVPAAFSSPALGLIGIVAALTLCLAAALLTIWRPPRMARVCSTIGGNRRGR
jgi:hypothetical protein